MSQVIFALDIGTRSVVGTILQKVDNRYHVLDLLSIEHKERSMIDGQIHNIVNVAAVIKEIKENLEEKHGPLKEVSVAAAGRALITKESMLEIDLTKETIASQEDTHQFELAAVQKAQQSLYVDKKKENDDAYYCVGYSVLRYTLDGQQIGSLIDQTGNYATVHVIATFLPQVVVESLLAALHHAELEMTALTLEPIAAIHVLVPPSMRKLNIALVDIGAGTSDIAIADQGTITAYGMVPLAGDEVTDALSQKYLVDFPIAEAIKRQLKQQETVEIEDILGFKQEVRSSDVYLQIEDTVDKIAREIAEEISRLNHEETPQAVILVGGGSLTPNLSNCLSNYLNLPENRVGIRGLEALNEVVLEKDYGQSPELVTPIGIAIASEKAPLHYMTVTINDKKVRLFESKEMTVGDAFIAANLPIQQMIGRPGKGMTITLNGKTKAIPGEMGQSSIIRINGQQVTMKHFIRQGDKITIEPGKNGTDAQALLKDLIEQTDPIQLLFNNEPITIAPEYFINGEPCSLKTAIHDRDIIEVQSTVTLKQLLKKSNPTMDEQPFIITVDNKKVRLHNWEPVYYSNGHPVPLSYELKTGDVITIEEGPLPTLEDLAFELNIPFVQKMNVFFNDKEIVIKKPIVQVFKDDQLMAYEDIVQPGDHIQLKQLKIKNFVFSDVFTATNYELPKHATGSFELLRNEQPIDLYDEIFQNDRLEIKFNFNYS